MMIKKVTPERVVHIVWLSTVMSCCWPLPLNSNKKHKILYKILQIHDIISASMAILGLAYSAHVHIDDIIAVCKCICTAVGLIQIIVQTIICDAKHDLLQHIVVEMMEYIREAKQFEREIFSKYIARCQMFYGCSLALIYTTTTIIVLGPMIVEVPLPIDVEYPFSINYTSIYIVLYIQQFILIYQGTAHLCLCMFGALLLWFTAARFECLAGEFQKTENAGMLITCIEKHLYLIRYAKDVTHCFRFIVLYIIIMNTVGITLCGILVIMNTSFGVKIQFVFLCFTVLMETYLYTWPADYLIDMSLNVSQSVYDISWYEFTIAMKKNLLNVMMYRKPIVLSAGFMLTELSLRYFCAFLSNAFSVFAALRVTLNDDEV